MTTILAYIGIGLFISGIVFIAVLTAKKQQQKRSIGVAAAVFGAVIFTFANSFVIIPTGYAGVKTTFGQISEASVSNGFNWKAPFIQSIKQVNCKQQDLTFNGEIWSETSNRTAVYYDGVTVTYQISSGKAAYAVDFDERNFGYCNAGYGLISSLGTYEGKPDFVFNEHYTDYLYIVNASGKNITLLSRKDREAPGTEVILPPDQMAIVCFYTVEEIVEREAADLQILPISEKEYNGFLFDQLSLLEDIENVAKKDGAVETLEMIERKRQQIERKLGQEMLVS
ncbi:MAG: hypothetical protein LUH14_04825 [Clostridiaceae bacterium]|nr:hypothetical protein [Clostridiaceae bacterium]